MKRGTEACKIQLCDNVTQDYFTNQGTELQTIHTLHQQSSQYYNGKTYIAFHGPNHDIYIKAYDHSKEKWTDIIYVADNPLPPGEGYGAPSLCIDDQGYLHIFYGCHTGALKYVKSTNPEDIYNWTTMSSPTTHCTYPQAFTYSWNSNYWIFLIYRGSTGGDGGHGDHWSYRISEDRGETWESEVTILTGWKTNGDEHGYYVTVQCGTDPSELSDIALHLGIVAYDDDFQASPHRHNVYYIYLSLDSMAWVNAAGGVLTLPLSRATLDGGVCRVWDSGTNYTNHARANADENGKNYVTYITDTGVSNVHENKCAYYSAGWNIVDVGTNDAPNNWDASNALNIISSVYAELYEVLAIGGNREIHRYISTDGGINWVKDIEISVGQDGDCVQMVRDATGQTFGGDDDGKIVFCQWTNTTAAKVYLYGDSGFVGDTNMEYEYTLGDTDARDLIQVQPIEVLDTNGIQVMDDGSKKKSILGIDYEIIIPILYVEDIHESTWETFIYRLMDWRKSIKVIPHIDEPFYIYPVQLRNAMALRRAIQELTEYIDIDFITVKVEPTII